MYHTRFCMCMFLVEPLPSLALWPGSSIRPGAFTHQVLSFSSLTDAVLECSQLGLYIHHTQTCQLRTHNCGEEFGNYYTTSSGTIEL